jgi:hypothetical protein
MLSRLPKWKSASMARLLDEGHRPSPCTRSKTQGRDMTSKRGRAPISTSARIVASISSTALAIPLGLALTPSSASAAPTLDTGNTLVASGLVLDNGLPVAGADVTATAWPDVDVLSRLRAGQTVPTKTYAIVRTDDSGAFQVSIDPGSLDRRYFDAKGRVGISLSVAHSSQEIQWDFSATNLHDARSAVWGNPRIRTEDSTARLAGNQAPTQIRVELGSHPTVEEVGRNPADWIGADHQALGAAGAAAARQVFSKSRARTRVASPCMSIALNEYDNGRSEEFVNTIGVLNARPIVIQKQGTDHTLGIAASAASSPGSFKLSGSATLSFEAAAETTYGVSERAVNKVNYRKYRDGCPGNFSYKWRPIGYHSLNAGAVSIPRPSWNANDVNCTTYSSGTYYKSRGTNVVFSAGVDLKVVDVSAEAKFSSETQLKWVFTGRAKLCGSSSSGWVSSSQAGAFVA